MTSKPARVRLDIRIDATDERLCGKECPRKTVHGECSAFSEAGCYTLLSEEYGLDLDAPHGRHHVGWWRSPECVAATKAAELDEGIVAAAVEYVYWEKRRQYQELEERAASYAKLTKAVVEKAKRADEAKEPKK